ncbi:MFS transporter [Arthrobacter sp. MYb211]|uniref:MFS transporter n=1 Tax=Micrococcaceae TaxID=1268 RepID=UPI000CFB30E8|nr:MULTISPECIES: MFS transporter [unclassified Arthrobacter]PRA00371.1 MFS transporter [Arthrobacter sp. MYb224]PRA04563.1 MFS transporter [Arthrobacter sp. MYb229]PRA12303.1 MFS transporter [Arthrobacter sp. MYb221]PRB51525.1 MFS transporter [Arthrobacter sp. MYb216]PRC08765.1 MFS transporter [Arthrobacter sp. MYb211]
MAVTAAPKQKDRASSTPNSRRNWGIVVMLLIFFMLNFADKAAIGLASTPIRESMNLSASQYGLLSSAFFWLFAVGAVTLTAVFRRISYNWAAGILMITWILTMLPLTAQTTFGVLLASRIALGFFEGPAHALCQSIVHELFPPEKRAAAGAVVNAGSSLGPLFAAPILTWIILTWDWHASFVFLVGISITWAIVWFFYADKLPFRKRRIANEPRAAKEDPNGDIVVPFYRLLLIPSFWGLALLSFAGYLITSLKVSWLPAFMNEGLGYSMESVGVLVTIPYIVAVVVLLGAGLLSGHLLKRGHSSRMARSFLTAACLLFAGASMITFTQIPAGPLQLVLVVAAFSINSVAFSIGFAGASDFLPAHQRASFFGCIIAAYSIAGMVAPYVLGLIVESAASSVQGYSNGFLIVGITICVFGVAGGMMLNPARARTRLLELTAMYEARKQVSS